MSETKTKACTKCGASKLLAEFYRAAASPDGLCYICKACKIAYNKEYRLNPPPLRISRRAKDGIKRCSICQRPMPVSEFSKGNGPDGLLCRCKLCEAARVKWGHMRRKFGITEGDWRQMLASQNGVCAICSEPETAKQRGRLLPLSVDHCHATGSVRGLLCDKCNKMLGNAQDDVNVLQRAIDYLQRADNR